MHTHKSRLLFISLLLFPFFVHGQDFEKRFTKAFSDKDTTGQLTALQQWEQAEPKDPELFIGWFNYYVSKSMIEIVTLDSEQKSDQALEVNDTLTGKTVGYMNSTVHYDSAILRTGIDYIDKGIKAYPTRLDMRFGKIYMLGEDQDYDEFTQALVETIEYGHTINDKWMWKEGEPLKDAKTFFLSSIQGYINTLYNTESDALLPDMRRISETVLEYDPDHVESLSDVAITYLLTKDYDHALTYLFKAEKVNPKDVVVLNNIAEAYHRKKDIANARIYYEKIVQVGNDDDIKDAREKIKNLGE